MATIRQNGQIEGINRSPIRTSAGPLSRVIHKRLLS